MTNRHDLNPEPAPVPGPPRRREQPPKTEWHSVPTKPWLEESPDGKLRTNIPANEKAD